MERIQDRVVKFLWKIDVVVEREGEQRQEAAPRRSPLPAPPRQQPMYFSGSGPSQPQTIKNRDAKVGRNDPCPCGSGKKYKKCHGTAA
jgi:preprotein translocase subunit SecA